MAVLCAGSPTDYNWWKQRERRGRDGEWEGGINIRGRERKKELENESRTETKNEEKTNWRHTKGRERDRNSGRERERELHTGCGRTLYLMGWSASLYFLDLIYYSYAGYREGHNAAAFNTITSVCARGLYSLTFHVIVFYLNDWLRSQEVALNIKGVVTKMRRYFLAMQTAVSLSEILADEWLRRDFCCRALCNLDGPTF